MLQENQVNAMATKPLVPCDAISSETTILIALDTRVIYVHKETFQIHVPS